MKDWQRKELIRIAASLAWCPNMPSSCIEDHPSLTDGIRCAEAGVKAENQCKKWAREIRDVLDGD